MKTNIDQAEVESLLEDLRIAAVRIESSLAIAGKAVPDRPVLPSDVLHSAELMEGHVAALEVTAKISGITISRPPGGSLGDQSRLRPNSSREGDANYSPSGQSPPTATQRLLADNGVRSLEELAAKRRAAHNAKRR